MIYIAQGTNEYVSALYFYGKSTSSSVCVLYVKRDSLYFGKSGGDGKPQPEMLFFIA